jgi:ribosomal protein S12 methylthiotransferase
MISLGCAKNLVDAEVMLGHLLAHGVSLTSDIEDADVVVVNTCGFIEDAKRESIDAILEAAGHKSGGRVKRLVVAGCMAQRFATELAREIPEIDVFLGLDELERAPEAVLGGLGRGHRPHEGAATGLYDHASPRVLSTGGVFAYLKVAEGCGNPCTFCTIPQIRGAFRSRTAESLLAEARQLESSGVAELVLVAQDTTRYGADLGIRSGGLRRLLETLLAGTSFPWIRVMYAHPATLDAGVLKLMARERRLVPYLDIPFQHASRKVLRAMGRSGDGTSFARLVARARDTVPGLAVRTTFIVGFPGEGEAEVAELQRFVADVRFDHVGVFAYSFQEENPCAALGDPVPARTKERRRRLIMRQQEGISRARLRELRGRCVEVLVDGASEESELLLQGRLASQAPEVDGRVLLGSGTATAGSRVTVRIRKTYAFDLVGDVVEAGPAGPPGASG